MPVDDILPRMRRGRQPMILVKQDEAVIGLITTEDILRTIVGKL
jgi:CBS domain containing-hemolysin-like protein